LRAAWKKRTGEDAPVKGGDAHDQCLCPGQMGRSVEYTEEIIEGGIDLLSF
jgi:hypothetical protein